MEKVHLNGVLYNKDKTELVRYPSGKDQSSYNVLDGTICIGEEAFENRRKIIKVSYFR
ncbi:MAG: hypothetical protein IJH12_09385 [Clostridia bacterium]|nr:hypothetical protein [Clostridia bacterium]